MIAKYIKDLLLADPAFAGVEVHHVVLPQGMNYPAVVFYEVSDDDIESKDIKPGHVTRTRWSFIVSAKTTRKMNDLAAAVKRRIDRHTDTSIDLVQVRYEGMNSVSYDEPLELFYVSVDFIFSTVIREYAEIWDHEGTLILGMFKGEGEAWEYGYRAGFGDDYGSIADFYTFYDKAGLYWVDDTLYLWGVNCSKIKIGNTTLENGIYNSQGFTSWECSNPFITYLNEGDEISIKIKGTVTETWDYEGVITVGEDGDSNYKGYSYNHEFLLNFGSINPNYNYTYFDSKFIYIEIGADIQVSGEISIMKIDDEIYNNFNHIGGVSTENKEGIDPFPPVGETCTIKIKL